MRSQKESRCANNGSKHVTQQSSYSESPALSSAERIRKHRQNIPIIHRATYDRAMQGKSLKSATKSFCLECVMWQKEEVRLCPSVQCPLYPYRPYKQKAKTSL